MFRCFAFCVQIYNYHKVLKEAKANINILVFENIYEII